MSLGSGEAATCQAHLLASGPGGRHYPRRTPAPPRLPALSVAIAQQQVWATDRLSRLASAGVIQSGGVKILKKFHSGVSELAYRVLGVSVPPLYLFTSPFFFFAGDLFTSPNIRNCGIAFFFILD